MDPRFNKAAVTANKRAGAFEEKYYISIGMTGALYTLRRTYLRERWVGGRDGYMEKTPSSYHIYNLSATLDEAIEKATTAAKAEGLNLDYNRDKLDVEMRKITRGSAEEMLARKVAYAKAENSASEDRDYENIGYWMRSTFGVRFDFPAAPDREATSIETSFADGKLFEVPKGFDLESVAAGAIGSSHGVAAASMIRITTFGALVTSDDLDFGKYKGKTLAEVNEFDRDYIEWITTESVPFDVFSGLRGFYREYWLEANAGPDRPDSEYVGEIKERIEIEGLVTFTRFFEGEYGGSLLIKIVNEAGNVFSTFYSGSVLNPKVGEKIAVKATVKAHKEYDGVKETNITRMAVIRSTT